MSASYLVDLGGSCQLTPTIFGLQAVSGNVYAASGATIGQSCYTPFSDSACNVVIQGNCAYGSGQLRIQVQSAPADVSGQYTDPTSGLSQMPSWFSSGGLLWLNSGALLGMTVGGQNSGQASGHQISSGFAESAYFLKPFPYIRANVLSGDFYCGDLNVAFVSQFKTTGSGAGFTLSPQGSGVGGPSQINV